MNNQIYPQKPNYRIAIALNLTNTDIMKNTIIIQIEQKSYAEEENIDT